MAAIFNVNNISLTQKQSPVPEFAWHTSERLASVAGSRHLIFDIRSLDPGKYSYPYHFHRNAEELYQTADQVDYYKGEDKTRKKWEQVVKEDSSR